LIFSFIGYVTTELPISSGMSTLDVSLEEDVTNLEEVVISGLASSIKRSNLGNAISSIDAEELTGKTTQSTLDNAMFGKITGKPPKLSYQMAWISCDDHYFSPTKAVKELKQIRTVLIIKFISDRTAVYNQVACML